MRHSSELLPLATTPKEVWKMILEMNKKFYGLKDKIKECLVKNEISVTKVADVVTSISPDGDDSHKMFENHVEKLYTAANHSVLFGHMNFHWSYLDPSLLHRFVRELELEGVKCIMEAYISDLTKFKKMTPLNLFCKTQKKKRIKLSQDFKHMVAEFNWPKDVTLEAVEKFRNEYVSYYKLNECAMMVADAHLGSFIITWIIPRSIVETLTQKLPLDIFRKHFINTLTIAGNRVYPENKLQVRKDPENILWTTMCFFPIEHS